jgi:hypothetical protein
VLGDGGNFLKTKPDPISVSKSHSISWLAQFICQIVTALKWEPEFTCEGIGTLADFKTVIEEVNAVDPVRIRSGARSILGQRPIQFCIFRKALVGVQEMQRLMVQAIAGAKQVG